MLEAEDIKKISHRFAELQAGALFMCNRQKKLDLAFAVSSSVSNDIDYIVWIAPGQYLSSASYVEQVKNSAGQNAQFLHFFSIENLSLNDLNYLKLYELACMYRVLCIVDGSVAIKNAEAGRTQRLLAMKHKFAYRLILSEIPLTRGILDLYTQFYFLNPLILNMTQTQFRHMFLPISIGDFDVVKRISTPQDEIKLIKMIRPYILTCDFTNNVDIIYHDYNFELTPSEAKVYEQEKEDFLNRRDRVAFLQVVQHFQYLYTLCKRKVDTLFSLIDDILSKNEKVIIYTKFLSEIRFLRESGGLRGRSFVVMSGNSNKINALNRFERSVNIMICTYKVEIPCISVKNCNNIIFFTQTFDYKDKLQIVSSCYGDDGWKLNVHDFWVNTRLEDLIKNNLGRKKNVLKNICSVMSRSEALNL